VVILTAIVDIHISGRKVVHITIMVQAGPARMAQAGIIQAEYTLVRVPV
jgi:hypothetical protein